MPVTLTLKGIEHNCCRGRLVVESRNRLRFEIARHQRSLDLGRWEIFGWVDHFREGERRCDLKLVGGGFKCREARGIRYFVGLTQAAAPRGILSQANWDQTECSCRQPKNRCAILKPTGLEGLFKVAADKPPE